MVYTPKAEEARRFIRDVLGLSEFVDVGGGGWLIMRVPEAEIGCHPTESEGDHAPIEPKHDFSFMCDDIQGTVADLKAKGVEFTREIRDMGWGFETALLIPGGVEVALYEPKYERDFRRSAE